MSRESNDTEVTLGTGRLLGLFFSLVVICAIFFALGFSMGRKSTPEATTVTEVSLPAQSTSGVPKPAAATVEQAAAAKPCPEGETCPEGTSSDELTFFKTVEQKEATAELEQKQPEPAPAAAQAAAAPAPELNHAGAGFIVQVAAVTKREDADALVNALRKKQYPVFVMDSAANDQFFRVQVGPFAQLKEAEAMKSRLQGDGYNPIVRK